MSSWTALNSYRPSRLHIAHFGKTLQARMDGVISYIDRISRRTGTAGLRQIQEDYLIAAFPVPVMRTVEEITESREEMRRQSRLFVDETNRGLPARLQDLWFSIRVLIGVLRFSTISVFMIWMSPFPNLFHHRLMHNMLSWKMPFSRTITGRYYP